MRVRYKNIQFHTAFTMIEIVFVIVVLGVLSYVGSLFIPDNRLINDTKYIMLQIKQKQKNAIAYDGSSFGENPWSIYDERVCVKLEKDTLNVLEEFKNEQKKYKLTSDIIILGDRILCFDAFGRPYHPSEAHILLKDMDINVTQGGKTKELKLFSYSGYVIIKD